MSSFENLIYLHRVCVCGRQQLWRVSRRPLTPPPPIPPPIPGLPPIPAPPPISLPMPGPPPMPGPLPTISLLPPMASPTCPNPMFTLGIWTGNPSTTGTNCPPPPPSCSEGCPLSSRAPIITPFLLLKLISRELAIYWLENACTKLLSARPLLKFTCWPLFKVYCACFPPLFYSCCYTLFDLFTLMSWLMYKLARGYLHLWSPPPLLGGVIVYILALHCQPPWVDILTRTHSDKQSQELLTIELNWREILSRALWFTSLTGLISGSGSGHRNFWSGIRVNLKGDP